MAHVFVRFCFLFVFLFCFETPIHAKNKGKQALQFLFTDEPIDVVIPAHVKDKVTLEFCIAGIKENCARINRVIVISEERMTENAEWFDEKLFPFTKDEVLAEIGRNDPKKVKKFLLWDVHTPGWYYQQLLKLYAPLVIPNISSNVLILDADTVFLNPVEFQNDSLGGLFCVSRRAGKMKYFQHAKRLVPGYKRINRRFYSVCHHMLFQKPILKLLFEEVEDYHECEFWKAFCRCVDLKNGGASEYEIYFNFAFSKSKQVSIRKLKWSESSSLDKIPLFKKKGFHFVSFHHYLRQHK